MRITLFARRKYFASFFCWHLLFHLFSNVVSSVDGGSDVFIFGVWFDPLVHGRDFGLLLRSHPPNIHGCVVSGEPATKITQYILWAVTPFNGTCSQAKVEGQTKGRFSPPAIAQKKNAKLLCQRPKKPWTTIDPQLENKLCYGCNTPYRDYYIHSPQMLNW